ncbi:MAG: NTP transferase domain-containing protein [Nitrospinae bacterium]|nr:NTP transferase domain-containing protein [Nitrospinota bacterium]
MQRKRLAAIVLAAGKGIRMKSARAKVLHSLLDRPILFYLLETLKSMDLDRLIVVVGFQAEEVIGRFGDGWIEFVEQQEQLGTGHAVQQAEKALAGFSGDVLVLCGDMPLLKPGTLRDLVRRHRESGVQCSLLVLKTREARDFGLVLRDGRGSVARIAEQRDATAEEKKVDEYNAGVYCFDKDLLFKALRELDNNNAQKEYYLTDTVRYLAGNRFDILAIRTEDAEEVFGVNTEEDLKKAGEILRKRAKA